MGQFLRPVAMGAFLLGTLTVFCSGTSLNAQMSTGVERQLIRISEIRLKPDSLSEWVELQKSDAIPMERKAGFPWRQVWSSGNEFFDRIVVGPIASLADLDGPNLAVKILGAEASAALHARIQRLVYGVRSIIGTTRPDLGFGTPPGTPRRAILLIIDVNNGRAQEFESFIQKDLAPALKKGGAPSLTIVQVLFGDDVNKYLALVPFSNYAEIASGGRLERALGPEGLRQLTASSGAFVSKVERRVIRYQADLSYAPATSPAQ